MPITSPNLQDYAERLRSLELAEPGSRDADRPATTALRTDIVAMIDFLTTVLAVFDDSLDAKRFEIGVAPGPGNFESLARARRYLGGNSERAEELADRFLAAWRRDVPTDQRVEHARKRQSQRHTNA
jgi:hypothetical protein